MALCNVCVCEGERESEFERDIERKCTHVVVFVVWESQRGPFSNDHDYVLFHAKATFFTVEVTL